MLLDELVDALAVAAGADRSLVVVEMDRNERVSNEILLCVGVLGVLGVEGIEAYTSARLGRESPEEKRSKALRLVLSSLGATASVAVDLDARSVLLKELARPEEGAPLDLPRDSRRKRLRFDFFSTPAGR